MFRAKVAKHRLKAWKNLRFRQSLLILAPKEYNYENPEPTSLFGVSMPIC